MENVFEQASKMVEQTWEQWRKVMDESSGWSQTGGELFRSNMGQWLSTLSSTYGSNMNAWNTFMSQNEDFFFKMFKESPLHSDSAEARMREAWDNMAKARKTYQGIVRENLERVEDSLRQAEPTEPE
ncbi:hypothetical protein ACFL2Q_17685 [Thermodesulfobacteriota bacterium]